MSKAKEIKKILEEETKKLLLNRNNMSDEEFNKSFDRLKNVEELYKQNIAKPKNLSGRLLDFFKCIILCIVILFIVAAVLSSTPISSTIFTYIVGVLAIALVLFLVTKLIGIFFPKI